MIKKIIILLIIFIIILSSNAVFAVEVFVNPHNDGFTTGDVWTIDRSGTQITSSDNNVTIDDSSGANAGWLFTVSVTDFTEAGINDPCVDSATLSARVDVEDWLSMTLKDSIGAEVGAGDIPATSGSDIPAGCYSVNDTIIDSGNLNVLDVQSGYGAGIYDFTIDYVITLDDWLPNGTNITSTAPTGVFSSESPVTVDNAVQKYQIFVGTYETTITYGVASNPP